MGTPVRIADAVLVSTQTTGVGTYSIDSALTGYFHPSEVLPALNGARVSYTVVDSLTNPTIREVGEGVLASGSPWTLTRATIRRSKNAGVAGSSAISWAAGTKYIFLSPIAANTPQLQDDGVLNVPATGLGTPMWGGTAGGTANALTATLNPAITSYGAGLCISLITGAAANSGAATLALNGLAAIAIRKQDGTVALAAGDLPANTMITLEHDGTVFRLMSVQPAGIGIALSRAADAAAGRVLLGVDRWLRYRNRIVNGGMQISQQFGASNVDITTGQSYTLDQWRGVLNSAPGGTLRIAQVALATPEGNVNRLRATAQVADATIAAGDYYIIEQPIEGQMMQDARFGSASARQLLLRFSVRSSIAGTFGVALRNGSNARSWLSTFTISAGQVNTDVAFTFAIPGDVSGTWAVDNTVGMTVSVCLSAGTTLRGSAGWQAGNFVTTSAQTNFMGTLSATFDLMDVALHVDGLALGVFPDYEVPDPSEELRRCQRYSYFMSHTINCGGTMLTSIGASTFVPFWFPTPMRATPSASPTYGADTNVTTKGIQGLGFTGGEFFVQANGSSNSGFGGILQSGSWFNARM